MFNVVLLLALLCPTNALLADKVATLEVSVASKPLAGVALNDFSKMIIQPLNIAGNKVGLDKDSDLCFVIKTITSEGVEVVVNCSSGKKIKNIGSQESHAGTRREITQSKGYIGSTPLEGNTAGMVGSGTVTDYFIPTSTNTN